MRDDKKWELSSSKQTLNLLIIASYFFQGVFDYRMKCWQKWQDAQVMLQKKREAEAKLQLANKPDKLQQAKDEIKEVNFFFERALSSSVCPSTFGFSALHFN